ncbi:hypothetical protein [Dokdonella sp.]|uniref:DUF6923 family protein n=1 Tax=Dokdonella sp. TaxID=2291710 RepID=UPI0026331D0F|nr:hypothetical protein [Dokdonella sp.]
MCLSIQATTALAQQQPPTTIYSEDFQNDQAANIASIIKVDSYTGAAGETYTASPAWLTNCNGWLSAWNQNPNPSAATANGECNNQNAWNNVQQLAEALGMLNGGTTGAGGTARDNLAVSAYTQANPPGAPNNIEIQSSQIPLGGSGRFLIFGADVAAVNCDIAAHPLLQFYAVDASNTAVAVGGQVDACSGSNFTAEAIGAASAVTAKAGHYTSGGAVLVSGNSTSIRINNMAFTGGGNDHAFDNLLIQDATPTLSKAFGTSTTPPGTAVTLTFTVTNTTDDLQKQGWSFTDNLPSGLTIADSTVSSTCSGTTVTVVPGGSTVTITDGNLPAGPSCTITVNVVASAPGSYTNGASNISGASGMNPPPAPATLVVGAGTAYTCDTPTIFIAQGTSTQLQALVSGPGGSSFVDIGSPSATRYNAIGYNTSDNSIYGVSGPSLHLVRIDPATGNVTDVGAITGLAGTSTGINAGAFDDSGNFYIGMSTDTTHVIYRVDLVTLAATQISISAALGVSDFTYSGGFFWAVPDGAGQAIRRIDPATGTVTTFPVAFLPAASAYGAAWSYGNGHIGFSNNDTGRVYQIAIGNPAGTPTFTLISSVSGPANSSNDGTACSLPTDLAIAKTGSATVAPGGALSWTLTVTNNGSGASSGFVVTDTVPAGVTNVASSTAGCTVSGSTVTCVGNTLAVGASATIEITGNAPDPFTACITNSASVLGNEADPSPANDSASFQTCPPGSSASITTTKVLTAINGAPPAAGQPVDAGDVLTYTITSTNAGQAAGATTLTETVPASTTYTGPDASAWTGCAPGAASPAQCTTVQNVPANGSASTTFTVRADQPLASGTREITNVVTSSADPVCAACSVTVPVAPVSAASITTRKVLTAINGAAPAAGQQVNGGDVLTYTITSTNAGQTAGATTLTETVPASVRYVGPDSGVWSGCASGAANPAQCTTVQNVPANGSTSTTFTVRADQPLASGTRSITNVVTSSADPACAACTATVPAADAQPGADPIPVPVNSTGMLALLGLCLVAVGGGMAFRQRR